MSRIANSPIELPSGVEAKLDGQQLSVKGSKGSLELSVHKLVGIKQEDNVLSFAAINTTKLSRSLSGTFRALVNNMVVGVNQGFEKRIGNSYKLTF